MRVLILLLFEACLGSNRNVSFPALGEVNNFASFGKLVLLCYDRLSLLYLVQKWALRRCVSFREIGMGNCNRVFFCVLSLSNSRWISWEGLLGAKTWLSRLFLSFMRFRGWILRNSNLAFLFRSLGSLDWRCLVFILITFCLLYKILFLLTLVLIFMDLCLHFLLWLIARRSLLLLCNFKLLNCSWVMFWILKVPVRIAIDLRDKSLSFYTF